jgi:hypothetical protein
MIKMQKLDVRYWFRMNIKHALPARRPGCDKTVSPRFIVAYDPST